MRPMPPGPVTTFLQSVSSVVSERSHAGLVMSMSVTLDAAPMPLQIKSILSPVSTCRVRDAHVIACMNKFTVCGVRCRAFEAAAAHTKCVAVMVASEILYGKSGSMADGACGGDGALETGGNEAPCLLVKAAGAQFANLKLAVMHPKIPAVCYRKGNPLLTACHLRRPCLHHRPCRRRRPCCAPRGRAARAARPAPHH